MPLQLPPQLQIWRLLNCTVALHKYVHPLFKQEGEEAPRLLALLG